MSLAYKSRYGFGFVFLLNILVLCLSPQHSWAGSADNSPASTAPTAGASTPTPQSPIDVIQNFNAGANSLNSSNCSGVCGFGSVKLNQTTGTEAVVGVFVDFNSPQKRHAKAQENLIKAQTSRIEQEDHISILNKLADAVEQCKDNHVHLLALAASKKLGITHEEVLSHAYKNAPECESSSDH